MLKSSAAHLQDDMIAVALNQELARTLNINHDLLAKIFH